MMFACLFDVFSSSGYYMRNGKDEVSRLWREATDSPLPCIYKFLFYLFDFFESVVATFAVFQFSSLKNMFLFLSDSLTGV